MFIAVLGYKYGTFLTLQWYDNSNNLPTKQNKNYII